MRVLISEREGVIKVVSKHDHIFGQVRKFYCSLGTKNNTHQTDAMT